MKRSHRLALALVSLGLIAACTKNLVTTDLIVDTFNKGALDTSGGDPFHSPDAAAIDLVASRIRQEMSDGYFGQGPAASPYVADWIEVVGGRAATFTRLVSELACADDVHVGRMCGYANTSAPAQDEKPLCDDAAKLRASTNTPATPASSAPDAVPAGASALSPASQAARARTSIRDFAFCWAHEAKSSGPSATATLCHEAERVRFVDFVRFESALERAARAVGALVVEGLVSSKHVYAGAKLGFSDTSKYLRQRGWSRSLTHKTTALVVKGGASTGVFSAGGVWVMLNIINGCLEDPECNKADLRFQMMSGTSTGALVATVVDMFNTRESFAARAEEMQRLAQWFTCSAMNDLYCVRSAPVLDLARKQDSLLEFDGLTKKLRDNVCCDQVRNSSELILNTVDFRTGRLLGLSDQEPFSIRSREDVVQGALASAVLPVIARPVYALPTNYDAGIRQAYLDGGIRSEIPVMSVARRGAERVLIVGSGSSITGETGPLDNAVSLAARYIDISTSGVIETELAWAQNHAESMRLSEHEECLDELEAPAGRFHLTCEEPGGCDARALCESHGLEDVCSRGASHATASSRPSIRPTLAERLEPVWRMAAILRDERRIEPLHGYTFDPPEQRRLFLAGAEAVRVSCLRVAKMLGINVPTDPEHPLRKSVARWCAPDLSRTTCGATSQARTTNAGPAACSGPVPDPTSDLLLDCHRADTPGACLSRAGAP